MLYLLASKEQCGPREMILKTKGLKTMSFTKNDAHARQLATIKPFGLICESGGDEFGEVANMIEWCEQHAPQCLGDIDVDSSYSEDLTTAIREAIEFRDSLVELIDEFLVDIPGYLSCQDVDGFWTIAPNINAVNELISCGEIPSGEDTPQRNGGDVNPDSDNYFAAINDHGNLTLYAWNPVNPDTITGDCRGQWREIWSVV